MPDRANPTSGPNADDIGRDAGSAGTNPEANAGGSNPRNRTDRRDAVERAGIDAESREEEYIDTAGSGAGGAPSAMSSTRLNTSGSTSDGLGRSSSEKSDASQDETGDGR